MNRAAIPRNADFVVIGGGAIGASIAFHLAEANVGDVVLLESDELAAGSTSKAAGGVRAQFSTPANVQLSVQSLQRFAEFESRPGWNVDFTQNGYLFLLADERDVEAFQSNIKLQRQHGVDSRLLTVEEIHDLVPILALDGVLAGAYCPTDGRVTPEAVVHGYAAGARRCGAKIIPKCPVIDIEKEGGRIARVVTPRGTIATPRVICAAGAWASQIGAMVDIKLPVMPQRQQILFTEQISDLPPALPLIVDFATGFYAHQDGRSLLLGMADPNEPSSFNTKTSEDWISSLYAVAARRLPMLHDVGLRGNWAGLYELTADHNPIIGQSQIVDGFYYAVGFSGHGLMHSPAVGEVMRDLVLNVTPHIDVSPFALERFATGDLLAEHSAI